MTASNIERYLRAGHTVREIARFLKVDESKVQFRADELDRRDERRRQAREARAERMREAAQRGHLERMNPDFLAKWLELPIRYEDEPRDPPFSYARAFANTVRFQKRADPNRTLGGVVSYETREAA